MFYYATLFQQAEPDNLNWRYSLALPQLMQRHNFQPKQAEVNLSTAEKVKPDIPELKTRVL